MTDPNSSTDPKSSGEQNADNAEVVAALQEIPVAQPAWRASVADVVASARRRRRRVRAARTGVGLLSLVAVVGLAGAGLAARGDGPEIVPAAPSAVISDQPSPSPTEIIVAGPEGDKSSRDPKSDTAPARPTGPNIGSATAERPAPPAVPAAPVIEDGRHTVFLTDVDVEERKVTFDLVQFLTGDEAKAAWKKAYPDSGEDAPPNDYFIVNENLKLRTLPVADDVVVTLVHMATDSNADSEPGTFKELPAYLNSSGGAAEIRNGERSGSPYDLTVSGGKIVRIDERFVP